MGPALIPRLGRRAPRWSGQRPATPGPKRVVLVVNPSKVRAERARAAVRDAVIEAGWPEMTVLTTTVDEPGESQGWEAVASGADLVVVAGGDGTVREVAKGVARAVAEGAAPCGVDREREVTLGVLPLGTANLFAHNLGISARDLDAAVTTALHGPVADLDLGLATASTAPEVDPPEPTLDGASSPFLVLAGIGRDAETVLATRDGRKDTLGWLAYLESAGRTALRRPVPMVLRHDDRDPVQLEAWSVLAASCGYVHAGVAIAPEAVLDDGLLDVLAVTVRGPHQWLPVAAKGVLHLPGDVPGLRHEQVRALEVSTDRPLPVQLDGDVVDEVRALRVVVLPRVLTVRVPLRG